MSNNVAISPEYLDSSHGKIFVTAFLPDAADAGGHGVVLVPPFAEEMNHSRRMMAEQARRLAENGQAAYIVDLFGTGDSAGDFGEATWKTWCDDLDSAVAHAARRHGGAYSLLAVRFGALLLFRGRPELAAAAKRIVLWQPCTSGKTYLRQFLRLRLASQLDRDTERRDTIAGLMERLGDGESVEIAGYRLAADMAMAIEAAAIEAPDMSRFPPITWLDVVAAADVPLSPATQKAVEAWRASGGSVDARAVSGAGFWGTVETMVVDELISATTSAFVGAVPGV